MAPPKTRDAKFRESFAEYMTGFTKALGKLHPNARYEYMYTLTKCGDWPGKKLHKYQLCIQKSDDTPSLPSVACWDGYFNSFYALFYQGPNEDNVRASVEFFDGQEVDDTLLGLIVVEYHQHFPLPYPHDGHYPFQENAFPHVMFTNMCLEHTATYLKRIVVSQEDELRRTETVFRATYEKLSPAAWDTCGVCYDGISPALLEVPTCFHLICRNCKLRCDKCPSCRMNF